MAKYRVNVPPPKAKRMSDNAKLVIVLEHAWGGARVVEKKIEKFGDIEFEVPNSYQWLYSTSISDGETFVVRAEFENSTGSRKEVINLVPEEIHVTGKD